MHEKMCLLKELPINPTSPILSLIKLFYDNVFYYFKKVFLKIRPCSSVVEQYPEKVCVVSAILTKGTPATNTHRYLKINLLKFHMVKNIGLFG